MVLAYELDARNQDNLLIMSLRVISLVPSATECLIEWGIAPIACTRFCNQEHIQSVGGTKDPNIELIGELQPDLVVMDKEENLLEHFYELEKRGIQTHVLHVTTLDNLQEQINSLAAELGIQAAYLDFGNRNELHSRAFVPIWRKPWMALGQPTYGASLLGHLGIEVVAPGNGSYPAVTLDQIAGLYPDVILAPSEPYPFTARQLPELETVAPVIFVDGQDLFWWGVRTPAALNRLREMLPKMH